MMIELKSFEDALHFLAERGVVFEEDNPERESLKYLFFNAEDNHEAVFSIPTNCACGYQGNDGKIIAVKKESSEYEELKKGKVPETLCRRCVELSLLLLKEYQLDEKEIMKVLKEVQVLSKRK